ncbi:MAG: substrate-binding domain-containing protein [Planctomycetes bacterium]|nr:substrate-binding domain-containing protein [Planctomycetota bacterium]
MVNKLSPAILVFAGSVLAVGALIGALYWMQDAGASSDLDQPLEVFCVPAMRLPMEEIAREYENALGQKVILHFDPSETCLAKFEIAKKGDLFLPADESYVHIAKEKNLVDEITSLATMHAVLIVRPGFPRTIASWDDFLAKGNKLGLPNPEVTAIGKLTKAELQRLGKWKDVEARNPTYLGDISRVGNAVAKIGASDVGIVFDAIALQLQALNPNMKIVHLKELKDVQAHIKVGLAKSSSQPGNARRLVNFILGKDHGAPILRKHGYSEVEVRAAPTRRPELVVYAGSMLQPAIEKSLIEFEKRENVKITRVYNGCGILVSEMKAGKMPDLYFACDTSFMLQVKEDFEPAKNVSNNQLMLIVKKGNPHELKRLADMGKPGLRVGVGHEHQCAMGALTKETFLRTGVYARVVKNVKVTAPTGDYLVNQMLLSGQLDVVVAYRSNWLPYKDKLDAVPIEGIPCAAPSQPIAVAKSSTHPDLSRRLMDFLQREESRRQFQNLGFGWEGK